MSLSLWLSLSGKSPVLGICGQFASLIINLETIWRMPTPCQAQQYASLRGKSGTCPGLNSGLSITDPCRIPGLQPCLLAGRWVARGPGRRLAWLLFRVSHSEQFFPRATILHDGQGKGHGLYGQLDLGVNFSPLPTGKEGLCAGFNSAVLQVSHVYLEDLSADVTELPSRRDLSCGLQVAGAK